MGFHNVSTGKLLSPTRKYTTVITVLLPSTLKLNSRPNGLLEEGSLK